MGEERALKQKTAEAAGEQVSLLLRAGRSLRPAHRLGLRGRIWNVFRRGIFCRSFCGLCPLFRSRLRFGRCGFCGWCCSFCRCCGVYDAAGRRCRVYRAGGHVRRQFRRHLLRAEDLKGQQVRQQHRGDEHAGRAVANLEINVHVCRRKVRPVPQVSVEFFNVRPQVNLSGPARLRSKGDRQVAVRGAVSGSFTAGLAA